MGHIFCSQLHWLGSFFTCHVHRPIRPRSASGAQHGRYTEGSRLLGMRRRVVARVRRRHVSRSVRMFRPRAHQERPHALIFCMLLAPGHATASKPRPYSTHLSSRSLSLSPPERHTFPCRQKHPLRATRSLSRPRAQQPQAWWPAAPPRRHRRQTSHQRSLRRRSRPCWAQRAARPLAARW